MTRQKGTLVNFMGDGEISSEDINKLVRWGKIPIGQERYMIIERSQLVKWGILKA